MCSITFVNIYLILSIDSSLSSSRRTSNKTQDANILNHLIKLQIDVRSGSVTCNSKVLSFCIVVAHDLEVFIMVLIFSRFLLL